MIEEVEEWMEEVLENGTFECEEDIVEFCVYAVKTVGEMYGLSFENGTLQTFGGKIDFLNDMTEEEREEADLQGFGGMATYPVKLENYKDWFDSLKVLAEAWKDLDEDMEGGSDTVIYGYGEDNFIVLSPFKEEVLLTLDEMGGEALITDIEEEVGECVFTIISGFVENGLVENEILAEDPENFEGWTEIEHTPEKQEVVLTEKDKVTLTEEGRRFLEEEIKEGEQG